MILFSSLGMGRMGVGVCVLVGATLWEVGRQWPGAVNESPSHTDNPPSSTPDDSIPAGALACGGSMPV